DEAAKAAASGMSRRKVIKLLAGGGAAAGLARLRLRPRASGVAVTDSQLVAARQAPTLGLVCAVLLSLVAGFSGVPFIGRFLGALLAQFGCPGISGASTCLPDGTFCDPNGTDCCGVCFGGQCVAAADVLPACCQCKDPLEELPAKCCTITSIGCGPAEIIKCQSECRKMGYFSAVCTTKAKCPDGPVCFGGFRNGLCTASA
ncbi:MAG TPA: hypothetical protein VL337_03910, partial [Acidimicrobiales bacterium]|nr:hypothetical protein [Acidimicrobiales bacterium]